MKILYIFDEDDKYGGPKAGMEMILSLREQYNITPIIITSKKNKVNELCDQLKIENYITYHHKYTYVKSTSFIKNILKIIPRFIRYLLGNIRAYYIINKKINMKSVDIIHCNISGVDLGSLLSKKYKIPNILHIREYGVGEKNFRVKSYRKNYIDFLNKNVTKFITISNSVSKFWIDKGIDKNKICKIYDGLFLEDINHVKKFSQSSNKKIKFIMLGSIHPGKGQAELIEAVSKLTEEEKSKIQIDIIGNGFIEEEKKIISLIEKYSLKDIIYMKNYDSDIREKLCEYDIGLNCSFAEGFGRVTVEYMSAGLCVIASNRGANEEIIINEVNGIIYDKDKPNDLIEKIKLVINNVKLRQKISQKALNDVTRFDINLKSKEIYDLYIQLKQ